MKLSIYNSSHLEEVKQLFINTFSDSEGESEGEIIGNLTYDLMTGADAENFYGFIAIENEQIIGSIFFTRLTFQNEANAFLLSPVATRTDFQGKGVGQKLINFGIEHLKANGVSLVITYGDPGFYTKVGFKQITEQIVPPPFKLSQPEGWLGQSLICDEIKPINGNSSCVEAFNNPELW